MRVSFFVIPLTLAAALLLGCGGDDDARAETRDRVNASCAARVADMRQGLLAFEERALAASGDETALPDMIRHELSAEDAFRSPDPCFGHASLATTVPELFGGEIDARFATLAAAYTNAGMSSEYTRLEPETARGELRQHVARIRVLAEEYAETEAR